MNSEFMLGQGAGQKLEFAVQRTGGTSADIDYLSTGENFRAVTLLRTGKVKLIGVAENGSEGVIISTMPPPTMWTADDDGDIHFTVTSNGFTPKQWERHLGRRGSLSDSARNVLRCVREAPTRAGTIHHIVVRQGKRISGRYRYTDNIRVAANQKGWVKSHWEVACLIRDKFTNKQLGEMDLWYIITMHKSIKDSNGDRRLLSADCKDDDHWFDAYYSQTGVSWDSDGGFAFTVLQIGSQT